MFLQQSSFHMKGGRNTALADEWVTVELGDERLLMHLLALLPVPLCSEAEWTKP